MAQGSATTEVDPRLVTRIVGSYVQHHKISVDELSGLIVEVRRTLAGLGRAAPPEEAPAPAVPVRRSVQQDYVICLDCGFRSKMLRRHIRIAHGLEPAAYRARWNLSADHPLTAPSYSERRSTLAKQRGFGRLRRRKAVAPPSPDTGVRTAMP
jgi:MucR family transcriptional regulator, transcriptional regulator of exopolysaccharide biosynthesis